MTIRIGIIDSGICINHPRFKDFEIESYNAADRGKLLDYHGTIVFDVIRKTLIQNNAEINQFHFYDIKVYDHQDKIRIEDVVRGIEYAIDNDINILNISLGLMIIDGDNRLFNICKKAYEKGIIIIAATDNKNRICYPAYYPFCLGIAAGVIDKLTTFGFNPIEKNYIKIIGKGSLQRVASVNNTFRFEGGTSLATAHISGIVANYMSKGNTTLKIIKRYLFKNGKSDIKLINELPVLKIQNSKPIINELELSIDKLFKRNPFKNLKSISIYPCSNKEFSNFIKFKEQCTSDIINYIDYPIGVNTEINTDVKIKREIKDLSGNTKNLIIGYPYDVGFDINSLFYSDLIKHYRENANIYFLEKGIHDLTNINFGQLENARSISIQETDIESIKSLDVLHNLSTPVVAVLGTTSRVGKFTYQIFLKKFLENCGYKVGWLSTESQGYFFGADYCFPYGTYSTSVTCNTDEWPCLINNLVLGIERYSKPDIIISGHQSGLIPLTRDIKVDSLKNLAFLSGLKPDAVICIVSPNDDFKHIKRTINSIKYYYSIPILCVVLNDVYRELIFTDKNLPPIPKKIRVKDSEWCQFSESIKQQFSEKVFSFNDKSIVNEIETFFSENQ